MTRVRRHHGRRCGHAARRRRPHAARALGRGRGRDRGRRGRVPRVRAQASTSREGGAPRRTASRSSRSPRPTRRWRTPAGTTSPPVRPGPHGLRDRHRDRRDRHARGAARHAARRGRRARLAAVGPAADGERGLGRDRDGHGLRGPVVRGGVGVRGRRARDRHGRADDPLRRRRRGRDRRRRGGADAARDARRSRRMDATSTSPASRARSTRAATAS